MSTRQYLGLIIVDNCLTATVVLARRPQKFHPGHEPGCGSLCQFLNVPTEQINSAMGQNAIDGHEHFCLPTQNVNRQCIRYHLSESAVHRCYPIEESRVRSVLFWRSYVEHIMRLVINFICNSSNLFYEYNYGSWSARLLNALLSMKREK